MAAASISSLKSCMVGTICLRLRIKFFSELRSRGSKIELPFLAYSPNLMEFGSTELVQSMIQLRIFLESSSSELRSSSSMCVSSRTQLNCLSICSIRFYYSAQDLQNRFRDLNRTAELRRVLERKMLFSSPFRFRLVILAMQANILMATRLIDALVFNLVSI